MIEKRKQPSFDQIRSIQGETILGISRLAYVYQDEIDRNDGDVELVTTAGDFLLGSVNGDDLRVLIGRWEDPFKEPLSEENLAYVHDHGCWRMFDCCETDPYREMIGQQMDEVQLLRNQFDDVAGVMILAGRVAMWFVVYGDECHVYWEKPDDFTIDTQ